MGSPLRILTSTDIGMLNGLKEKSGITQQLGNKVKDFFMGNQEMEQETELVRELSSGRAPGRVAKIDHALVHRTRYLTAVFENTYQSHNAAAAIRCCEGFGLQAIHVVEGLRKFRPSRQVTMGADRWMDIGRHRDVGSCLESLKGGGYRIAAATLRPGAVPLQELPLDRPLALLIGHERKGLSEEAHEGADLWFHLPMYGLTQSFNLSVFCALCLYDLTRRLRESDQPWLLAEDERRRLKMRWLAEDSAANARLYRERMEGGARQPVS